MVERGVVAANPNCNLAHCVGMRCVCGVGVRQAEVSLSAASLLTLRLLSPALCVWRGEASYLPQNSINTGHDLQSHTGRPGPTGPRSVHLHRLQRASAFRLPIVLTSLIQISASAQIKETGGSLIKLS